MTYCKRWSVLWSLAILMALIALCVITGGCSGTSIPREEAAATRKAMDQATATIREEHKEWTAALGPSGNRETLPTLTQEQVDRRMAAHKAYEDLMANQDRRDAEAAKTGGGILGTGIGK